MSAIIFDTNIWITYKPARLPANLVMSTVVMQELVTGASDKSEIRDLQVSKRRYETEGRMLVPDSNDWWQVGIILNSHLRGLKSRAAGKTPRIQQSEKSQIVRDALIAVTAHRIGALIVTDNLSDFEKIRRYCKVRLKSGKEFFDS